MFQIGGRLPIERELLRMIPGASPLLPDPGMEIQLVHHDDCAEALVAAVEGRGTPGIYNLAGPGTITLSDVAEVLGWRSVRLPHVAVDASTELVARLGRLLPQNLEWINVARRSVPMSTAKAADELGWAPQRSIEQTLRDTVDGARAAGII